MKKKKLNRRRLLDYLKAAKPLKPEVIDDPYDGHRKRVICTPYGDFVVFTARDGVTLSTNNEFIHYTYMIWPYGHDVATFGYDAEDGCCYAVLDKKMDVFFVAERETYFDTTTGPSLDVEQALIYLSLMSPRHEKY